MELLKPLGYYTDDSSLCFHLLSVSEGLMILIVFPNNQVMLFDSNVTRDNEEEILGYLEDVIPTVYDSETDKEEQPIHAFVNSHRDDDHLRGLKKVNAKFPIQTIWDSGQSGDSTQSDDYLYYMGLRRRLKEKDSNNLIVPVPSDIPIADFCGVEIFCFASEEDFSEGFINGQTVFKAAKIQHTNSMVLQIKYGGTSLLLAGDSDWKSWKDKIIPNFQDKVSSSVLFASHHGSRSFFTDESNDTIDAEINPDTTYTESIDFIDPDITLISCGEFDTYHHPNKEAKEIYLEKSKNEQVYTTHDCGHLLGFIDYNGNYTVVPSRFCEKRTAAKSLNMNIECTSIHNGNRSSVVNGASLPIGRELHFELKTSGGIIDPFDKVSVWWEVSNGGANEDSAHQEIYYKEKNETEGLFSFKRELSFLGTHLLRCRLYNRDKGSITRIFKITGKA